MSEAAEKPFDATPQRLERASREGNVARAGELGRKLLLCRVRPRARRRAPDCCSGAPVPRSNAQRAAAVPIAETAAMLACCLASPAAGAAAAVAANALQSARIRVHAVVAQRRAARSGRGMSSGCSRAIPCCTQSAPRSAFTLAAAAMLPVLAHAAAMSLGTLGRSSGGCRGLERQRARCRDRVRYRFALRRWPSSRARASAWLQEAADDLRRAQTRSEGSGRRSARSRAAPGAASLAAARRDRAGARGGVRRGESNPSRDRARIRSARRRRCRASSCAPPMPRRCACASSPREYGIPVVENVPLARALFRDARPGDAIAHAHYVAVAEVVAALIRSGAIRAMNRLPVYAFAALLLAVVGILIVPLPPWLLDVLLAVNVFGSSLVLLLSVTVEEPLQFSAFAPALLVATLFRLSLDVSATRLILTQGATPGAVGSIIPAFGAFVVNGNLVVGAIVFAILVTIQFVVIASGSQRVAEVAARFTLDAMPGKQMAIDADVHAGALDADGARRKRQLVQREADFYGAMDGAGKFVKGDAVAALVIVALNLAGGIVVGVAYHGMSPLDALEHVRAALDRQRARDDAAGVSDLDRDGDDGHARRLGRCARRRSCGADVRASGRPARSRRTAAGAGVRAGAASPAVSHSCGLRVRAGARRAASRAAPRVGRTARARARAAFGDAPARTRARSGRRRRHRDRHRRRSRAPAGAAACGRTAGSHRRSATRAGCRHRSGAARRAAARRARSRSATPTRFACATGS